MSTELSDLMLDDDTGDLYLDEDESGNPVGGGTIIDDIDALAQWIRIRLQMFFGSWFLDHTKGVPYFEQVLGMKGGSDPAQVNAVIVETILTTPGVVGFKQPVEYTFDNARRLMSLTAEVQTVFGTLTISLS